MAGQSKQKSKFDRNLTALVSIGAAAISLYSLYYIKIGVPQIAVETVREGIIEVARTAWNETKSRIYFLTSTMPGLTLTTLATAVASHIVYLQTNSRAAKIVEIFFGITAVSIWAAQHFITRQWPVFRIPLPDNNTIAERSDVGTDIVPYNPIITSDIRAILDGCGNMTEFITLMFIYLCKDMSVVMLNENVIIVSEEEDGLGSLRLIQYGKHVVVELWIPKLHQYVPFIDTGNMEATASIFRDFTGRFSNSGDSLAQKRVETVANYKQPINIVKWY